MKQERFKTGMYVVDEDYRIVCLNQAMAELYPNVKPGDICYKHVALLDGPCESCPLAADNALFYNPIRKEWIYANAAKMPYPGHGDCYHVQFQLRQRVAESGQESLRDENMDEFIRELSDGDPTACAIGGYCEPGSPLAYANEALLKLMGYAGVEELSRDVDGLVSNTIHPDDVERVTGDLTRCALQGGQFETTYRMRRKDQSWIPVVGRGTRVETRDGSFVLLSVIWEVHDFVKRQSELRDRNAQLLRQQLTSAAVLEHMPGGYHRCAAAEGWPFLYFGSSFEKITGWTREEIEGQFGNLFINMVLDEDIPLCAGIVEAIQTHGYSNAIYRLKKKGGGYIWVSDSTMRVDIGEEHFYQGVLADVSEQIAELEAAKQAAEASNQAKSTFLFNASHDIRTPMNAIIGFAHIIEQNAGNEPVVRETIRKVQQTSRTLMTLLNDVLDLARIERGKDPVDLQPLNLEQHAAKLYEMFAGEMEKRGLDFRMENDVRHPDVLADELKLTRMAINLLSNAKKFTPAGGRVCFGIRETDFDGQRATYRLFVQDTGIGMSREFQEKAFEQFERERSSTDSGMSGSGLGLAIIKKLADLLGGECVIESRLGQGTTITVTAPLTITARRAEEERSLSERTDFSGRRVLIVEDNDFNREIARYVFESVGFAVDEAENGSVCVDKLLKAGPGAYDLVLMDIQMPVMDGNTATREIRSIGDRAIARVPIIAMTANAFEEDRRRCRECGMDGHISKPLQADAVLKEFRRVLDQEGGAAL